MYDYIIAGGGCAGLSLAYRLQQSPRPFRLLLIDLERKEGSDRTWCFWHRPDPPHAEVISHRWSRITVRDHTTTITREIAPYHYCMIRGADFYRHLNRMLDADPRITRVYGLASAPVEHAQSVTVTVDGTEYHGGLLFDSTFEARALAATIPPAKLLLQHFYGQFIEFERPLFDPTVATLFDFRAALADEMQFLYLLPLSATRALLEHTIFTPRPYPEEYYRRAITRYIDEHLRATPYRVLEDERGVIPMTTHRFPRRLGRRVVAIGTKGGRVKPSTGFAFLRIQRDAERLAAAVERYSAAPPPDSAPPRHARSRPRPLRLPADPLLYRIMDALLLEVMRRHPQRSPALFMRLFARNPIQRIFALLDEELPLSGALRLMARMPWAGFFAALWRLIWRSLFRGQTSGAERKRGGGGGRGAW